MLLYEDLLLIEIHVWLTDLALLRALMNHRWCHTGTGEAIGNSSNMTGEDTILTW